MAGSQRTTYENALGPTIILEIQLSLGGAVRLHAVSEHWGNVLSYYRPITEEPVRNLEHGGSRKY